MKDMREVSGIICFYLGSHLLLDIFDGGIFLLYPFYNGIFYSVIELIFEEGMKFNIGISNDFIDMSQIGEPMISSENFGVAILLLIVISISIIIKREEMKKKEEDIDMNIT